MLTRGRRYFTSRTVERHHLALISLCKLSSSSVIQTFTAAQNVTGGFGSGHGQVSHIAPSYAVVLSLAMVGGSDALEIIDRKAM